MKNTMLKGTLLGLFVFALALPSAQAEFWGHKGKMSEADHEKFMEEHRQKKEALFKEIGVSDEQLKQIEARREATMEGNKELMQDYMAKKQALGQALDQPQVNRGEVDRKRRARSSMESRGTHASREDRPGDQRCAARLGRPRQQLRYGRYVRQHWLSHAGTASVTRFGLR